MNYLRGWVSCRDEFISELLSLPFEFAFQVFLPVDIPLGPGPEIPVIMTSGYTEAEVIRRFQDSGAGPEIPVIMTSGYTEAEVIRRFQDSGVVIDSPMLYKSIEGLVALLFQAFRLYSTIAAT